jgi:hypothetical protein
LSPAADVRRATAIEMGRIYLPTAIATSSILMTESISDCASACKLNLLVKCKALKASQSAHERTTQPQGESRVEKNRHMGDRSQADSNCLPMLLPVFGSVLLQD